MSTDSNTKSPGYPIIPLAALILAGMSVLAVEDSPGGAPGGAPVAGPEEMARVGAPVVAGRGGHPFEPAPSPPQLPKPADGEESESSSGSVNDPIHTTEAKTGVRASDEAPSPLRQLPPAQVIIDAIENKFRAEAGREPGPEEIVAALNRSTLGLLRDRKYRLAERVACVALDLARWRLWDDHPQTLISINNLATLYSIRGRFHRAELLLGPALKTSEKVLGKGHPNTLTTLDALAFLYDAQGLYGKAKPLLVRALDIRRRALGDRHADTRNSLVNLARLHFAQGHYREAESLHARVLKATGQVLGEDHPDTLSAQLALAIVRIARREFASALDKLRWMNARLGEVAAADTREEMRARWRRLRSDLHNVVLSLALMILPVDARQDALRLVADILLTPERWKKKGDGITAYLARVSPEAPPEGYMGTLPGMAAWPKNWRQRQEIVCVGAQNGADLPRQSTRITYSYRDDPATPGVDWQGIGASLGGGVADGEGGGNGETPAPVPAEPEGNPERPEGDSWKRKPGLPILQPVRSESASPSVRDPALLRLCAFHPIDLATGKTGSRAHWLELQVLLSKGKGVEIFLRDLGAVTPIESAREPARAEARGIKTEKTGPPAVRLPARWPDTMLARYRNVYVVLDVRVWEK